MIIKYSPVARKKLAQMKKTIGSDKVGIIVKAISDLKFNPLKCPSVERMLGISSRYYFLIYIMKKRILCGKCSE